MKNKMLCIFDAESNTNIMAGLSADFALILNFTTPEQVRPYRITLFHPSLHIECNPKVNCKTFFQKDFVASHRIHPNSVN